MGSQQRRQGFTIVETMVAMTVLGVGLVGVFGTLQVVNSLAGQIREQEAAQLLAEQHMTSLLAGPIDVMGSKDGQEGLFKWVESIRPGKNRDIAEVVVTVAWLHQGRPLTFQLVSLKEVRAKSV